ncbi:MAG TPA: hypothetical protein O0W84_06700, partial [Methanocorpusculum sp.]|nr:hypothetical protein [Methanocorpusculum sp.]
RAWVNEFKHVCKTIGYRPEDLLKLDNLTAHPVPEDVKLFPVYAVDKHDYCLCGKDCNDIMHISEIREEMEENPDKYKKTGFRRS